MLDTTIFDYYADFEFDTFNTSILKSYNSMLRELKKKEKLLNKESQEFEKYCRENSIDVGSEDYALHYEFYGDLVELQVETMSLRERLSTIGEMRVVYLYKTLEITIKNLLRTAYKDKKTDASWDSDGEIKELKKKGIHTKNIEGYSEINNLRLVNNAIKHSDDLQSDLNSKFVDFKNTHSFLDFEDFDSFHNRILPFCSKFINSLKETILADLNHS